MCVGIGPKPSDLPVDVEAPDVGEIGGELPTRIFGDGTVDPQDHDNITCVQNLGSVQDELGPERPYRREDVLQYGLWARLTPDHRVRMLDGPDQPETAPNATEQAARRAGDAA